MEKTIKEKVREAIEGLSSNGDTTNVEELMVITGLTKQVVYSAAYKLEKGGMVEKTGRGRNRRYRYIGPKVSNIWVLESNQEGFSLPLVKCALRTRYVNTAVHIGWKTHDGEVFCLCGANEVARKRTSVSDFDPDNWNEVSPEKYKNVTCKKCISAWYTNKTRTGDTLSAQEYVRAKIRRDHIEKTYRGDTRTSAPSEPIPLDDNMNDEPIIENKKRTVTIRFDDTKPKKNDNITKDGFEDGDIFNVQVKLVKLEHVPDGKNPRSYKCQFCCFNGLRPCPRASLEPGENRFLCYEIGAEYYFIEVLSKQG